MLFDTKVAGGENGGVKERNTNLQERDTNRMGCLANDDHEMTLVDPGKDSKAPDTSDKHYKDTN